MSSHLLHIPLLLIVMMHPNSLKDEATDMPDSHAVPEPFGKISKSRSNKLLIHCFIVSRQWCLFKED